MFLVSFETSGSPALLYIPLTHDPATVARAAGERDLAQACWYEQKSKRSSRVGAEVELGAAAAARARSRRSVWQGQGEEKGQRQEKDEEELECEPRAEAYGHHAVQRRIVRGAGRGAEIRIFSTKRKQDAKQEANS
eukprot:428654-Hanusia_phi.AAC.1